MLAQLVLLEAYNVGLPFKGLDMSSQEVRVLASQIYLVHVLSRIHGVVSPKKYSRALYKSRYSRIYPENGMYLQKQALKNGFRCFREKEDVLRETVAKLRDGIEGQQAAGAVERAADFVAERGESESVS